MSITTCNYFHPYDHDYDTHTLLLIALVDTHTKFKMITKN